MKNRIRSMGIGGILIVALLLIVGMICLAEINPAAAAVGSFLFIPVIGTVYTEPNYLSDVLLQEAEGQLSRERVTVASGQNLALGTVIGKITIGAVSETHVGNTGNGAMTLDATTPALAYAQKGAYRAVCIVAAENGGTFRVYDPKGNVLGDVVVGGTFANQIKFVITDGTSDFIVGDTFTITVAAGSGSVKILTPAALDGTQDAYGIIAGAVDASSGALLGTAITRLAVLKSTGLTWPAGITDGQKAAALAQLDAKFITTRGGA